MIYDRYAEVYDTSGQIHFSLRMISYLADLLERHGWQGETTLDLACGTGTLALSFAQRGLRAYGVDASAAMLKAAEAKAHELELHAEFSQQDMRDFRLPEAVDLVTCCYDSLNYLLSIPDLTATFRRVREALRPGGLFAFDVNTPWQYEHLGCGTHFAEGEGVAIVIEWTYDEDARFATIAITGFVRKGELYERFAEMHEQRAYAEEEIASALAAAGLEEVARYHCFGFDPPGPETPRTMWVARRPLPESGPPEG
ncbi:MAG: class I SAM-dependent methyltransferase [Dehalococcoidales bacterium]|nr:class I SAM-dependent methyltransferase [Dehalococcoidales bacterium]